MHSLPVGGEVAAAVGVANSMPAMVVAGCTCSAVAGVAVVAGVAAAGFSPLVTAITVVAVEMVVGTAACGCSGIAGSTWTTPLSGLVACSTSASFDMVCAL